MNNIHHHSAVHDITGVLLAGGRARRMGGQDKGLLKINGIPMISIIADTLRPQVANLLVNANRNPERYAICCRCPVIADIIGDFAGPLAGMASAMQAVNTPLLLSTPCDSPCLADDYASRMLESLTRHHADIAVARDSQRLQPVFALLRTKLLPSLLEYLHKGQHKIDLWYAQHEMVEVDFSDCAEMFININTPDDHLAMEQRLRSHTAYMINQQHGQTP